MRTLSPIATLRRLLRVVQLAEQDECSINPEDVLEGRALEEWLIVRREAKEIVDAADAMAEARPN